MTLQLETSISLEVEYEIVKNPNKDRVYPVDILTATFRGKDIYPVMHIGHIMTLQRQVFNRLVDEGEITVPINRYGVKD